MTKKVPCYVHTFRRKWGLTQDEVASLVGQGDRDRVAAIEQGLAPPNGREILAYCLIFGARPGQVFPGLCEDIEDAVMRGGAEVEQRLARKKGPHAARVRQLLAQLAYRVKGKASITSV